MICSATYVIGLTGIIYEKGERLAASGRRQVPVRGVPWLDATSRRRRPLAPINEAAIFITPDQPSFFEPAQEPNKMATLDEIATEICRASWTNRRTCAREVSATSCGLRAAVDSAGSGFSALEVFDCERHFNNFLFCRKTHLDQPTTSSSRHR